MILKYVKHFGDKLFPRYSDCNTQYPKVWKVERSIPMVDCQPIQVGSSALYLVLSTFWYAIDLRPSKTQYLFTEKGWICSDQWDCPISWAKPMSWCSNSFLIFFIFSFLSTHK